MKSRKPTPNKDSAQPTGNQLQAGSLQPYNHAEASKPKGIPLSRFIELCDKGLQDPEIAKIEGCSKQAVQQRRERLDIPTLKDYRDNKSLHMTELQLRLVKTLTDEEIKTMSPYQRVVSMTMIEDKFMPKAAHQVNVLNISMIVQDIDKRIRKAEPLQVDITPTIKQEDN
jgi:hypothetical protein